MDLGRRIHVLAFMKVITVRRLWIAVGKPPKGWKRFCCILHLLRTIRQDWRQEFAWRHWRQPYLFPNHWPCCVFVKVSVCKAFVCTGSGSFLGRGCVPVLQTVCRWEKYAVEIILTGWANCLVNQLSVAMFLLTPCDGTRIFEISILW